MITAGCISGPAVVEKRLVFQPMPYPDGDWSAGGVLFEDVWFQASDGTRLHGWYAASPHPRPRGYVLYCHGNAGNLTHRAPRLQSLAIERNVCVFCFDYRGYGRSEGSPSESGLYADARAARDWLAQRAGIPPDEVTLLGRSLGGAVAVELASTDGARGLILENTFTSMPDAAAFHFPWLPTRLILRTRFDSVKKLANYQGPVLISHAQADQVVDRRHGPRLMEVANEPKEFVPIPGAGHNDPPSADYLARLDDFLDGLPPLSATR